MDFGKADRESPAPWAPTATARTPGPAALAPRAVPALRAPRDGCRPEVDTSVVRALDLDRRPPRADGRRTAAAARGAAPAGPQPFGTT